MSSTEIGGSRSVSGPSVGKVDMKLEVVVLAVTDVDRAKDFYAGLGWRLDADFPGDDGVRIVQVNPPGSGCSIRFGSGLTSVAPGSTRPVYLIVPHNEGARDDLIPAGAAVSEVFHERS